MYKRKSRAQSAGHNQQEAQQWAPFKDVDEYTLENGTKIPLLPMPNGKKRQLQSSGSMFTLIKLVLYFMSSIATAYWRAVTYQHNSDTPAPVNILTAFVVVFQVYDGVPWPLANCI